jgi:hypothetical protein
MCKIVLFLALFPAVSFSQNIELFKVNNGIKEITPSIIIDTQTREIFQVNQGIINITPSYIYGTTNSNSGLYSNWSGIPSPPREEVKGEQPFLLPTFD